MLRAFLLHAVTTAVCAQTCARVPALYSGGLCNGTTLSMNKCISADQATQPTQSAMLINGTRLTAASCEGDMSGVCAALQGSLKPEYCRGSVGSVPFCRNLAVATASTSLGLCTADTDCSTIDVTICPASSPSADGSTVSTLPTNSTAPAATPQCNTSKMTLAVRLQVSVICCTDIQTTVAHACTGVDTHRLDVFVRMMRDSKQCAADPDCASSVPNRAGGTKSSIHSTLLPAMLLVAVWCTLASGR